MSRHRSSSSSTRRLLTLVLLVACLVVALSPILVRAQGCETSSDCGEGGECRGGECTVAESGPFPPSEESFDGPSSEEPHPDEQFDEQSDEQFDEQSDEHSNESSDDEQSNDTQDETSNKASNTTSNSKTSDNDVLNGSNSTDDAFLTGGSGISYTGPGVGSLDKGFSVTIIVIVVIIGLAAIVSVGVWWYRKRQTKHAWNRLTTYHEQQQQQRNSLFSAGTPQLGAGAIGVGGARSVQMSTASSQSPRIVEEGRGYHITSELERPSIESGGQSAIGSSSHLANPVTSTSIIDPDGGGSNTSSQFQLQTTSFEGETTLFAVAPSTSTVDLTAEEGTEQRPSEHSEPRPGENE